MQEAKMLMNVIVVRQAKNCVARVNPDADLWKVRNGYVEV